MTTGTPRIARWVVLEPTLGPWIGHQRALFEAMPALARERAAEVALYAGAEAPAELAAAAGLVRLFRFRPLPEWAEGEHARALARFVQSSQEMLEGLRGPAGPAVSARDVVLLPTAHPWGLVAVGSWLRRMAPEHRPRVAAVIHEGAGLFVDDASPVTADQAMLALGTSALVDVLPRDRLLLAATTAGLAAAVRRGIDRPVGVAPVANPVDRFVPAVPAERRRAADGAIRIALPGAPREGKRRDLTAAVIAALRHRLPDAFVHAQIGRTAPRPPDHPRLQLHIGALADADYAAVVTGSAIAVLPYDPALYRERVSGVFIECAAAGCAVVVPAGTWMAAQIEVGAAAGTIFAGTAPDAVAEAAGRAAQRLPELSAAAMARAPSWRAGHGPRPFIDRIEAMLAGLAEQSPA